MLDRIMNQANQMVGGLWEQEVEALGQALEDGASAVGQGAQDVINLTGNDVAGALHEAGDTIGDVVTTPEREITGGIESVVRNTLAGRFANALEASSQAIDAIVFGIPRRIVSGIFNGTGKMLDAGSRLLGPLGAPVRAFGHGALDIGRTFVMTVGESVRDIIRIPGEIGQGIVRHGENAIKLALAGQWGGAILETAQVAFQPLRTVLGAAVDVHIRVTHGVVSSIGTLFGRPPTRGLTADEKVLLRQVYGDSIDVDSIRLRQGDLSHELGLRTHAVGNTIYMEDQYFDENGNLNAAGLQTLVHEAAHVSQQQNGGGDYMHTALLSQGIALLTSMARGDARITDYEAYDWCSAVNKGVPYDAMTPEQQAHLAEEIGKAILNDDDGILSIDDFTHTQSDGTDRALTPAEYAWMMAAWGEIKVGEGAV